MDVLGRDKAPFSGRVWQQIDAAMASVKAANCTARRFLEIDGPYGLGLTSLARDDQWLDPWGLGPPPGAPLAGAQHAAWGVRRAFEDPNPPPNADPDERIRGRGTYLVSAPAVPVPLIVSEFVLGIRNVEAFDDECQPLDLEHAKRAARDVALAEERLIYYGNPPDQSLRGLLHKNVPMGNYMAAWNVQQNSEVQPVAGALLAAPPGVTAADLALIELFQRAIRYLAERGFPGPFALAASPLLYTKLFGPAGDRDLVLVDLLRPLFAMGIHLAPVIVPQLPPPVGLPPEQDSAIRAQGVIVTCNRLYARLVVGQDWAVAYRGVSGAYHLFRITSSLRLEMPEPEAIQTVVQFD